MESIHFIWNPTICSYKNNKYLANIIANSVITCEETKTVATKFNEKNTICKTKKILINFN